MIKPYRYLGELKTLLRLKSACFVQGRGPSVWSRALAQREPAEDRRAGQRERDRAGGREAGGVF